MLNDLPKIIPIFPLSNFILFPKTAVPLKIFEPRYVEMINDSMKSNKFIGMIQPKMSKSTENLIPELYDIGCLGKIVSFKETEDNRYLIELRGIVRFEILTEVHNQKSYQGFLLLSSQDLKIKHHPLNHIGDIAKYLIFSME